jgi:hypothetical protein
MMLRFWPRLYKNWLIERRKNNLDNKNKKKNQ